MNEKEPGDHSGQSSVLPDGWTWSDLGHGTLDIIGFVPVIGEFADAANAAWYTAEGKYLEAGLSLISCVPMVGDVVGKGGKVAVKTGGKAARKAADFLKEVDFRKALEGFRTHPQIGPHVDEIAKALDDWRKKIVGKFPVMSRGAITKCPFVEQVAKQGLTKNISKTPVPVEVLLKIRSPYELATLQKAIEELEGMPFKQTKEQMVFYSGKATTPPFNMAYHQVDAMVGNPPKFDYITTMSGNVLNKYRHILPDSVIGYLDRIVSSTIAQNAKGVVRVVGDPALMNPLSIFRTVELPALLKNPNVTNKKELELLMEQIDRAGLENKGFMQQMLKEVRRGPII